LFDDDPEIHGVLDERLTLNPIKISKGLPLNK
jgi:hypothetical protein